MVATTRGELLLSLMICTFMLIPHCHRFVPFRTCVSYDPLVSPHQLLPHPDWMQLNAGVCLPAKKLYACSSECSDHSLKSHSLHSQHSIASAGGCCATSSTTSTSAALKPGGGHKGKCDHHQHQLHAHRHPHHHNIYENDEQDDSLECCPSERDTMLSNEASRATSSAADHDSTAGGDKPTAAVSLARTTEADACFSYSESIYAEADDPKLMPMKGAVVVVADTAK